jgi:nucleotide-binding universal stress UspA family protein
MTDQLQDDILVGFSNSAASGAALRWAVAEADRRRCRVRVLHVYDDSERADARLEVPAAGRAHHTGRYPGRVMELLADVATESEVVIAHETGSLFDTLRREAADAQLLVIGMPGDCRHRGLDERLRRSVSCPVEAVPAP